MTGQRPSCRLGDLNVLPHRPEVNSTSFFAVRGEELRRPQFSAPPRTRRALYWRRRIPRPYLRRALTHERAFLAGKFGPMLATRRHTVVTSRLWHRKLKSGATPRLSSSHAVGRRHRAAPPNYSRKLKNSARTRDSLLLDEVRPACSVRAIFWRLITSASNPTCRPRKALSEACSVSALLMTNRITNRYTIRSSAPSFTLRLSGRTRSPCARPRYA